MKASKHGPRIEFTASQWCVFYDGETGEPVHIHEYLIASEKDRVGAEELEEQARQAVGERLRHQRISVIHPPAGERLNPRAVYSVDLKKRCVVVAEEIGPELDRSKPGESSAVR